MGRYRDADEDYSPFDDDYRGFSVDDDESARGPLILALALGVLLVFGAVVWNTYRQGIRDTGAGIPSVIADSHSFKRLPEDRGGTEVRDTDKRFYDQMDASDRRSEIQEALNDISEKDTLQGGPPIELRPGQDVGAGADSDPDNGMPRAVEEQVRALASLEGDAVPPAAPLPAERRPVTPAPVPVAQPQSAFNFRDQGSFLVQIAAFRSAEAAETAWQQAQNRSPNVYRGAHKRIQRADLGAKGVFYRLRVGEFLNRTDASVFCDAVKKIGDNCIVVSAS